MQPHYVGFALSFRAAPMHLNQQKEQFSIAFIRAVAATAGYNIASVEVDDDSIDIGLRGNRHDGGNRRAPALDIQAKCTASDDALGDELAFDLTINNYDDLREATRHVPLILVVICVPALSSEWLLETPEHTAMRRCAYWTAATRGQPPTTNTRSARITIPRTQRFTVEAVRALMTRIGHGELP